MTDPRSRPLTAWLLLVGLVATPVGAPAIAQSRHFERDEGVLWQVERSGRYRVDAQVVSIALLPAEDAAGGEGDRAEDALVGGVAIDGEGDDGAASDGQPPHAQALAALLAEFPGLTVLRSNRAGVIDLALPEGADPLEVCAALRGSDAVAFAEPNTEGRYDGVPNDPLFGQLWHLENVGQLGGVPGADLSAVPAWDLSAGDPSIVVAVIDSGVEWSHPDLAGNIWTHPGEIAGNAVDDDGNGFVDDVRGWDFEAADGDPSGIYYHGTAVAGVVAAVGGNGVGVAGLAGGSGTAPGCRVMPLCVGAFAPKSALLDDAIVYAADMGARVITLSLAVGNSAAVNAALEYAHDVKGVFIDCASGNNGNWVSYPADHPLVVAVGSTDRSDHKSAFSNAGPELRLAAPGEEILMTTLGGGYTTSSGTSFAAPQVGALAALLLSLDPGLTPDALTDLLTSTAVDVGPTGWDQGTGHGRIDALAALTKLAGGQSGSIASYGTGLAGTGGKVPSLEALGGAPQLGNAGFKLKLTLARAGAPSALLIGVGSTAVPFKDGVLLVDVTLPVVVVLKTVSTALGSKHGTATVKLPVPIDPSLLGAQFSLQWIVLDGAASDGLAMSAGLAIEVGG